MQRALLPVDDDGAFAAAERRRRGEGIGHRTCQHHGEALRVLGHHMEGVGHFAVGESIDATRGSDRGGQLRLAPHHVEGRQRVVEEVGGDAARIIPPFAEVEIAVRFPFALGRGAQEALPVDVVVAFGAGSGAGPDLPVPLALYGIAVGRTLAHDEFADGSLGHQLLDFEIQVR